MTDHQLAICLAELERLADRLTVHHRKPEKFHEDKSELVERLAKLRGLVEAR